jgi:hypothetical protein
MSDFLNNNKGETSPDIIQKQIEQKINEAKSQLSRLAVEPAGSVPTLTGKNSHPTTKKFKELNPQKDPKFFDGANLTRLVESYPNYDATEAEKVYSGENNTFIVLGRDRQGANTDPSYGSLGAARAGAIDIFCGIGGTNGKSDEYASKSMVHDSARIYLSMKANIDAYLMIPSKKSPNSQAQSAIAIMSDSTRIIGRKDIKIVSGSPVNLDSNGKPIKPKPSIYLIGNYDETNVQPLVKGQNLVEFLKEVMEQLGALNSAIKYFALQQNKFNLYLANHTHLSNYQGNGVVPNTYTPNQIDNPRTEIMNALCSTLNTKLLTNVTNLEIINKKYIEMLESSPARPILSDNVFAN